MAPVPGGTRRSEQMEKTMPEQRSIVRVAAVGDIHAKKNSHGLIRPLFAEADRFADVLVLCGDLTDYGLPEERTCSLKNSPWPRSCRSSPCWGITTSSQVVRTRSSTS